MSYIPFQDFYFAVSQGLVTGLTTHHQFGKNTDIDAGTSEDIWAAGGTWVPPTAARVHAIVSDSTDDAAAGLGCQTLRVIGLNASYVLTTEDITMDGTTPVNTVNSYIFVDILRALTAGASGPNVGTITATAAVDGTVTVSMLPLKGESQTCIYQVPAGYTAYISGYQAYVDGGANASVDVELYVKPFGGTWNLKGNISTMGTGNSNGHMDLIGYLEIEEKSIVKLRATSDTNNMGVSGVLSFLLKAN